MFARKHKSNIVERCLWTDHKSNEAHKFVTAERPIENRHNCLCKQNQAKILRKWRVRPKLCQNMKNQYEHIHTYTFRTVHHRYTKSTQLKFCLRITLDLDVCICLRSALYPWKLSWLNEMLHLKSKTSARPTCTRTRHIT